MTTNETTNIVSNISAGNDKRAGRAHIGRRRWLRLMATLAGVMLLAMQVVPVLAAPSSASQLDATDLSYLLGKEETGYDLGLGGTQSAPQADAAAFAPVAPASFGAPEAGGAGSSSGSQILRDALAQLESQTEAAEDDGQQDEAPVEEAPADVQDEQQIESEDEQPADIDDEPASELDSSSGGEELTLVARDEFTNSAESILWAGEHNGNEGILVEEDGGWYVMLVQPGVSFPLIATSDMTITDGLILTDAHFSGEGVGEVGIVGRSAIDSSAYYHCGIDVYGSAGCDLFQGGQWQHLFTLPAEEVTHYDVNRLMLDIYGDTLTFYVNDTVVGSISDAGVTGGSWGVATVCFEGQCAGSYDYVEVYQYGEAAGTTEPDYVETYAVVDTDFINEPVENWFTGEGEWGFADLIDDYYVVAMNQGWYFPNEIAGTEMISDGVITINTSFEGAGSVGVIARMSTNDAGASSYYVCWLNSEAFANCHVVVDDVWYEIEGSAGTYVTLEDVNVLSMIVTGDRIGFGVNSQMVTDAKDRTLSTGSIGLYHEAFDTTAYFDSYIDSVVVETFADDAGNGSGVALGSELNENDLGLYVDQGEWGATSFFDGYYVTELAAGWSFTNTIADTAFLQDGLMTETVAFGGEGATGLMARTQYGDAGMSYYVCWLNSDGFAGCHVVINDEWYELGVTEQALDLGNFNELSMAVEGSDIGFAVNGEIVIHVTDDTLASGDWGFFTDAHAYGDSTSFVTYVDTLTIEAFTS